MKGIKRETWRQMNRYLGLAFVLPTCVVAGWLIGGALDKWLGTGWIHLAGLGAGIAAGFVELIRTASKEL